jgi:DNA repair exonuclease SbcCD nuclease subunit
MDSDSRYPGCNSRAVEILKAVEAVYANAALKDMRHVVIPGDVFHRRGIVLVPLLNALCEIFHRYADSGIKTILLPGNHDYVDKHAKYEADHLHALYGMAGGNVIVVSEPQIFRLFEGGGKLTCGFIPYTPSRELWIKRAQSLAAMAGKIAGDPAPFVLFAHQSFNGAATGPHEFIMPEGISLLDIPEEVTRVISGHYHLFQNLNEKLTYVGGIVQHNFGERMYTPGHLEIDLKRPNIAAVHLENEKSPRFAIYEGNDETAVIDTLVSASDSGDYTQIRWTGKSSAVREIREAMKGDFLSSVVEVPSEPESAPRLILGGLETTPEIIEKYMNYVLSRTPMPSSLPSALLKEGIRIFEATHRGGSI